MGRLLSSHRSPVRPAASFRLRVPHLLDVSGLNSVISSFLPLFFLSWSPENNAAVNGGERVFTHYMRVKSAHLGVVLVLIGLFAAPSACSIFQCPPVLAVFTAVHLTSNLGFPHRWCLVSLAAVRALDSGSSSEKFRRSPMCSVSLSSSCCDKDAGGFFMVSFHKIGPRLTSGPCN